MAVNINNFVIDASAVLVLLLPDEKNSEKAKKLLGIVVSGKNRLFAPKLLEFEVGNALKSAFLSKRIAYESLGKLINNFKRIPIIFTDINTAKIMELAVKLGISFYDASYIYLTKFKKCKLLTLDRCLEGMVEKEVL